MQLEMSCHLKFQWVCDLLGGNLRGWRVSFGVGWCPLPCGSKYHLVLQACRIFHEVDITYFGRRFHVVPKFRSQCLSHFDAQFGWGFPLKQGDDYAQLDWMDLEGKK